MNQNQRPNNPSGQRRNAQGQEAARRNPAKKPVKKQVRKKRKKLLRVKNPHLWRNIGIAAAITAALFFTLSVFFKIDRISVTDNDFYSAQQVIDASGIQRGDNLLALSKAAVSADIQDALPYVSSVQVRRVLPNEVLLAVEETSVAYAVKDNVGNFWLITCQGKVLQAVDAAGAAGHIFVSGFVIENPVVGEQMTAAGGEQITAVRQQAEMACRLLTALEQSDLADHIVSVDVPSDFRASCWYGDQYQIIFGNTEDFDYKLRFLTGVLAKLDSFTTGEIDLTFNGSEEAIFRSFQ